MRVALTGASGFIGSFIARELTQQGHKVTALIRDTSRTGHISDVVDRFITGEQHDETCWPALLEGAECIVHNSVDWKSLKQKEFDRHLATNLDGSIRLLWASAPIQFIFVSTIAVHHDMRPRWQNEQGGLIDEDHPLRPNSRYGAMKAAIEAHLWAATYGDDRNCSAFRPCAVYGIDPDLPRSHGYEVIKQLQRGEPFTRPKGGKIVHVEDVAKAVVAAVGNPAVAGRPFNLVDCYTRWADWAVMAAEELGVRVPIDLSSPDRPINSFKKDAVQSLGVSLNRDRDGVRQHLRELIQRMK